MSISSTKITEYQVLLTHHFKNILTPSQLYMAINPKAIAMLEVESGGSGGNDKVSTYLSWIQSKPLAMKFLTGSSTAANDFQSLIWTTPAVTAADALPSTYVALHAETLGNEPKLAGVIEARLAGVDSTYKADGANLGAGSAGTLLDDAGIMGLYATWGKNKFNAIFDKNVLKTISNESNTSYDTIGEVAALYSAWTGTVNKDTFFAGLSKLVGAGLTTLKFSELYGLVNNQTNFNLYTSDAAATLMGTSGATWSGATGLSATEFAALTSANAITAIKHGGATYTSMTTVYTADTVKYATLTSNNAAGLMAKGLSGIDFSGLSTAYGTTYTTAKDVAFNEVIDSAYWELMQQGVSLAHMKAIQAAGLLKAFTPDVKGIIATNHANYDTISNDLVSPANYSGLETIGGIA